MTLFQKIFLQTFLLILKEMPEWEYPVVRCSGGSIELIERTAIWREEESRAWVCVGACIGWADGMENLKVFGRYSHDRSADWTTKAAKCDHNSHHVCKLKSFKVFQIVSSAILSRETKFNREMELLLGFWENSVLLNLFFFRNPVLWIFYRKSSNFQ